MVEDQRTSECSSNYSAGKTTNLKKAEGTVEILKEGQECPFCGFAKMKREGNEIICPICGYGYRACT